jgi:hypothetical protein
MIELLKLNRQYVVILILLVCILGFFIIDKFENSRYDAIGKFPCLGFKTRSIEYIELGVFLTTHGQVEYSEIKDGDVANYCSWLIAKGKAVDLSGKYLLTLDKSDTSFGYQVLVKWSDEIFFVVREQVDFIR